MASRIEKHNILRTIIMRPSWKIEKYNNTKINLANNVCYDTILLNQVSSLIKSTKIDLRQYPEEVHVYRAISAHHEISMDNIAIGFGIGELIVRVLNLKQNKKISIVSPTWPMVETYSEIFNIEYCTKFDETATTLYLANPNGMSGECLTRQQVLELLPKFDLVIVDEAYGEFATIQYSVIDIAAKVDNLIVLKTFSKSLSLAGIRLGYAIANTEIIKQLQLTRPSGVPCGIITPIITDLFNLIPSHVSRMNETRNFLESNFDCIPSNGNFVLMKEPPIGLSDHFLMRTLDNGICRMALADLTMIKNACKF
jgi:histidinol-phosphate/aromatic aminotransferase/cobyric acid decarboxylase-like protein